MTAAVAQKCPECGQGVMTARALTMGEWREHRFTARPAIVYTIDDSAFNPTNDVSSRQAVRYRPDLKLHLYHEAVCPRRQLRQVVGADVAKCRSCPAAVTFVRSPAGALLPLDYEPVTPYEVDQESLVLQAVEHVAPAPVFLSHFANCFSCGHTPPPAVLLGIHDGSIDARAEVARFESELPPGMNRWRDLKKRRLTGPRHNNSRL